MAEEKKKSRGFPAIWLAVVTGILVPVLAVIVPPVIDYWRSASGLEYEYLGPIKINNNIAFRISVRNGGNVVEESVKIWLPRDFDGNRAVIDATVTPRFYVENNQAVVAIGNLRPDETADISVLVQDRGFFLLEHELERLKVTSDQNIGEFGGITKEMSMFHRFGFWAFFIIVGLFFGAGLVSPLLPKSVREKMILDEIEKL